MWIALSLGLEEWRYRSLLWILYLFSSTFSSTHSLQRSFKHVPPLSKMYITLYLPLGSRSKIYFNKYLSEMQIIQLQSRKSMLFDFVRFCLQMSDTSLQSISHLQSFRHLFFDSPLIYTSHLMFVTPEVIYSMYFMYFLCFLKPWITATLSIRSESCLSQAKPLSL